MATQPAPGRMSFAEYLEFERQAGTKSEYRAGEIFAMAGGSEEHSRISVRVTSLLEHLLVNCRTYNSDMKVYAAAVDEGMYPDASVICDQPEYQDARRDVLLNPVLVVEVLSPTTREYDLSLKAGFYRTIPSLQMLVFIDSESRYVQRQTRQDKNWSLESMTDLGDVAWSFAGKSVTLGEVYSGILSAA